MQDYTYAAYVHESNYEYSMRPLLGIRGGYVYTTDMRRYIDDKAFLLEYLKANNQKCFKSWTKQKLWKAVMAF